MLQALYNSKLKLAVVMPAVVITVNRKRRTVNGYLKGLSIQIERGYNFVYDTIEFF
jgi:hypothetical protein